MPLLEQETEEVDTDMKAIEAEAMDVDVGVVDVELDQGEFMRGA